MLVHTRLNLLPNVGTAMRTCDSEGEWSEPDVLQCTTVEFINLEDRV